eukprot:TRINITY_DN1029_c0_g1_i1.p1 TRINITY_DN1029_c0_g1~~TRINITY_DN1029_c0_g1_i1.p1  ORF type:complete len:303 (-),score=90.51 TRINITY_DN1029_c0_g1_i1:111-1019(-)
MSRPEHSAPPELFYNEAEAEKYHTSSRMIEIQTKMSERAVELLCLPSAEDGGKKLLLDIGCGSGLSGAVLEEHGHMWVGIDISPHMLAIAAERGGGDVFLGDMGDGMFFRPGMFDGAISVSALQWLCNADKRWHEPRKRIARFFQTLYACLAKGARAVFQFYPENAHQMELITSAAMRCGFTGGLVVDYPNSSKAKKYFLCLFAGAPAGGYQLPKAKGDESNVDRSDSEAESEDGDEREPQRTVAYGSHRQHVKHEHKRGKHRDAVKSKNWVLKKKESQRKKGKDVRPDTKYTARKRQGKSF